MKFKFIFSLFLLSLNTFSNAESYPNFDCNKASNYVERSICKSERLATLDHKLGEVFAWAKKSDLSNEKRSRLLNTQKIWLKERNKCTSNQCITYFYRSRIDEICSYKDVYGESACKFVGADTKADGFR